MIKITTNIPALAQPIFNDVDPPIEALEDVKSPGAVATKEMQDMVKSVKDERQYGFKDNEE